MNLLVVIHNLKREGAQLVAFTLATRLKEHGTQVRVAAMEGGPLEEELARAGVEVKICDNEKEVLDFSNNKDVVLVNSIMLHGVVQELHKAGKSNNTVWLIHESNLAVLYSQLEGLEECLKINKLHERCAAVAFVCNASLKEFTAEHPDGRFTYIHNGVDVSHIKTFAGERDTVRSTLGVGPLDVVVLTAGTPKPRKGQLGVAQACQSIKTPCLVVGCSTEGTPYEEDILQAQKPDAPKIHLIERGPAEHVYRHMAAADLYVCNSAIESFPLSILEAMSLSLPVVTTDINGIPEQVTHGKEGLLYPITDTTEHLENCLTTLVTDKSLRLQYGTAAYERVQEHFSLDAMVAKWADLLRKVL
eukprot:TRINITY_DN7847_c0_g1_i1.p1 TRINITY_DN7847_c0_g1~~TRINITY_DN7847_c0_g1_i1.p1  ORF type:complete len:360 (+),score=74.90 TRINITY_DN7847_c0_g1_i1:52-1131(+)